MNPVQRAGLRNFGTGCWAVLGSVLALSGIGCASADPADPDTGNQGNVLPPGGMLGGTGGGSSVAMAGTGAPPMTGSGGSSIQMMMGSGGTTSVGTGIHSIGNTPLPCDVGKAVAKNCGQCHGAMPIGGAPMPLITQGDFQADHVVQYYKPLMGQTKKVYELAKLRINDKASPMPPGGNMAADEFTMIDSWLAQGAPAGTSGETCDAVIPDDGDGSFEPLVELEGETCYELKVHGSQTMVDDTKYMIPTGEEYVQFYYDVPWETGSLGSRYGTVYDNKAILHHWLLFTTLSGAPEGTSEVAPLPTLIGDNATLLAGWAIGGSNLALPKDAGFELPPKGTKLNVQWHFYNSTGGEQGDHSSVQVCTVKAGTRPHIATITWVGTEDLNGNKWTGGAGMPPGQMSQFSGTCDPLREGMTDPAEPIHILGFWPHMHNIGVRMEAIVNHKDGKQETVFDKPFQFDHQIHYLQNYDLAAGDTITARCTYNNTNTFGVPFGESTDTEMCYNFMMAWPAHALENHVVSLIGATNTCW